MQVSTTTYTIARFCEDLHAGKTIVNRDYQRSDTVWPPAARSYLIDTILQGYPLPKFTIYPKTDLKTRRTINEIVDGQQRSKAILDFFDSKLRISGQSKFAGKRYQDLADEDQKRFIEYALSVDVVTAASEGDIRQMFRRINSYTVPLNPEEQRHAIHQGDFKWFIVGITERHANLFKRLGVFNERNLSRMQDAKLFTEIVLALRVGIETYSKRKLDNLYKENEEDFAGGAATAEQISGAVGRILDWEDLHGGPLMSPANFLSLVLAVIHCSEPVQVLSSVFPPEEIQLGADDVVVPNLATMSEALAAESPTTALQSFVDACSKGTNTKAHREERFRWFCRALGNRLIT